MEGIRDRFARREELTDDDIEDLNTELAKHFTCPICMDVFFEPVTLICGHSYCIDCLYKLEQERRNKKECPACRTKWTAWPHTTYALNELVKEHFPRRYARGHREREAEAQRVREITRQIHEEARQNRSTILANEGKVFLIGLLLLCLLLYSQFRGQYYHYYIPYDD